jgi:hypothetical protein
MLKWTKKEVLANLYLMKIHILIFKLFIIRELSSWRIKIFH